MTKEDARVGRALSRAEFERDVIHRASVDPAFRQELLTNPKAVIQAVYGVEIPPDVDLQVLEETPSRFYLILPVRSAELTDEELAAVAGGIGVEYVPREQIFTTPTLAQSLYFSPGPMIRK